MKNFTLVAAVVVLSIIISPAQAQMWSQAGSDIDGKAENDQFGTAVAMSDDGNRIIVGAHQNDDNGNDAGHVQVYEWNGNDWVQLGSDIQGETDRFKNGEYFGYSVDISGDGNTIVVGAPQGDVPATNAGYTCIFTWEDGTWTQVGDTIYGEEEGDYCGSSVSLSENGERIAVGSEYFGLGSSQGMATGKVRVFELTSDTWSELGSGVEGEAGGDKASRVALNGDGSRMVIASPYNKDAALGAGHIRIFELKSGSWVQLGSDIDGESANENFGISFAINNSGTIVAAGAPSNSNNGFNAGAVRIFEWKNNSWQMQGSALYGKDVSDLFGFAISLSKTGALIGVGSNYAGYSGEASIHRWDGTAWIQMGDTISGENESDISGSGVALAGHGARIAIGAPHNADNGVYSGHVRVFDYTYGVGINELSATNVQVYPNPSSGIVYISTGSDDPMHIQILNDLGQEVSAYSNLNPAQFVDLSPLGTGVYTAFIEQNGVVSQTRVTLIH